MKFYEGKLVSKDIKIGIVAARFNEFITSKLLSGAVDALTRHDVKEEDVYRTSVLRGIDHVKFVNRQSRIEKIINSPLDIATTINENKGRIIGYFQ